MAREPVFARACREGYTTKSLVFVSRVVVRVDLPFGVKRAYYLYDIPGGENRGAHAHKELQQLIIAASGSFTVVVDDGKVKRSFFLNRPYQGLLVPPGIWRDLVDFSSGSVLLCLASETYEADDYIREYHKFLTAVCQVIVYTFVSGDRLHFRPLNL